MRRLVHLSDLHFGRTDSRVVHELLRALEHLRPHLVAVSGDLTQRAKHREYEAARDFLQSIRVPKIVVPGNHDIPLYNVVARFARPLRRFRRYIAEDVEPTFVDEEIAVVGVNTARSLTFKSGRINADQVERARDVFCNAASRVRVLVTHHPFDLGSPGDRDLVGRATMAMQQLRECMPDVLLAGHLHTHEVGTTAQRYNLGGRMAIVVQAGTATSTRGRGEHNSFNVLDIDATSISVSRHDWRGSSRSFVAHPAKTYRRVGSEWTGA